jgi:hypothetical protein
LQAFVIWKKNELHTLARSAAGGLSGIPDYVRYTLLSSPFAPVEPPPRKFCWLWPMGEISHPCKIWGANLFRVHHIDLHAIQGFQSVKVKINKAHQISIFGFQCVAQIIE